MAKQGTNTLIMYESGQSQQAGQMATADGQTYTVSGVKEFSGKSGFAPVIMPDGVISGFTCTTDAVNDTVNFAAGSLYLSGVKIDVTAVADVALTRGTAAYMQVAFVYNGATIIAIEGTDHTAFSDVVGDPGGPPYIPVDNVLIAVVKLTSATPAVIATSEINQDASSGTQELASYPAVAIQSNTGFGQKGTTAAEKDAFVKFAAANPLIHTGDTRRKVFANVTAPVYAERPETTNWVPAEESASSTSTQIYRKALAAASTTVGQASFDDYPDNPLDDPLAQEAGEVLTFKTYIDENDLTKYWVTQGITTKSTSVPAGDNVVISYTITPQEKSVVKVEV